MRKIINYISVLIVTMFVFSIKVDALTASLSTNKTVVKAGESFTISLNANDVGSGLGSFTYIISYDSSLFEYKSSTKCSSCTFNNPSDLRYVFVDMTASNPFSGGNIGTMTFTAKTSQTTKTGAFTLTSKGIKDVNGNALSSSNSSVSVKLLVPSTNADLNSLSASGINLTPAFNKDITSYTATTDNSSTTINAVKVDENSTVSNTGYKNLNYGVNTFDIVVTAQAGNTKTYKISITRNDNRSKDNTLKSLNVSNTSIGFNPNKTEYNITLSSNVSMFELSAVANDSKSKINYLPSNKIALDYGKSATITINVTAENGLVKTYRVTATRKDDRDKNNSLKTLTVSNTNIKYNGSTSYSYTVENKIDKIDIKATSESTKAKISGVGTKNLKVGSNKFTVSVTAENGSVKNYIITVIRKTKDGEKLNLSNNNYLSSLEIEGVNINFDKNTLNYSINVENSVEKLNIKYTLEDQKANVVIENNDALKIGLNDILIKVTAENGETKTYTLSVIREKIMLVIENDDEKIIELLDKKEITDLIHVKVKDSEGKIISKKILEKLKETRKNIVFEVVNESNAILYSVMLDGEDITSIDKFDYTLTYVTDDTLKSILGNNYIAFRLKGKLPGKVNISILVNEFENDNLILYKFENEEVSKYQDLTLKDNYTDFEINDNDTYVIANMIEKKSNNLFVIIGLSLTAVIITIIIIFILKKKKTTK